MGLGRGKTEHAGPRDMTRKHGHWGFTEEAKEWASRARRRDEAISLRQERAAATEDETGQLPSSQPSGATGPEPPSGGPRLLFQTRGEEDGS
jgi:hypothetical protein